MNTRTTATSDSAPGSLTGKIHRIAARYYTGLALVLSGLLLLSGCGPFYYPGIYGSKVPPMLAEPRPGAHQAVTIDAGKLVDYNPGETNHGLRAHYVFMVTSKFAAINSGFFGYYGNYRVVAVDRYRGYKNYYGLGPFLNLTLHIPVRGSAFGVGAFLGQGWEFGAYERFLVRSAEEDLATNELSPCMLFAAYPYLRIRTSPTSSLSLQVAVGLPGYISSSITFQQGNYYYWISALPTRDDRHLIKDIRYFSFGFGFGI